MKTTSYKIIAKQIEKAVAIELNGHDFCSPFFYNSEMDFDPSEHDEFDFNLRTGSGFLLVFKEKNNKVVEINDEGLFYLRDEDGHKSQMLLLVFKPVKVK